MKLEIFDSNFNKNDIKNRKRVTRCRAIIEHKGRILAVYEKKWNMFTLPGGSKEDFESLEECVLREVLEETGVIAIDPIETVRVIEHFESMSFETVFFTARFVEETGNISLTELEKEENLSKVWFLATDLLEKLENSESTHPYAENISHREFLGLIHSIK